jgi:hypothetical protein
VVAPLVGHHLEKPAPGRLEGDLVLTGWVLAQKPSDLRVVARADGVKLGHVRADRARRDVAEAFPDHPHAEATGFRMQIPRRAVPRVRAIELFAEVNDREHPFWLLRFETPGPEQPRGRRRLRDRARKLASKMEAGGSAAAGPGHATERDDDFRVVALISTYNEEDIIGPVLDHLADNGIATYLLDDNSSDQTIPRAEARLGRGLLAIEQLPQGPEGRTAWRSILARKAELSRELGADWYIHHDADEFRESPWPGVLMRNAIRMVDRLGYNAIDFRVLNFPPVDDAFRDGADPRDHFRLWEDPAEYDRIQRKCWKAGFSGVELADGGHDIQFDGRRLFPLRFLLRHYPIRGQAHGTRKVLKERKDRFAPDEVSLGWHRQYAHVKGVDHSFLRSPAALRVFDLDQIRVETALLDGHQAGPPRREEPGAAGVSGALDHVSPTTISGWVARDGGDGAPLEVTVWDGPRAVATVVADENRSDLEEAGIPGGRGFKVRTPRELLDGRQHWIWATAAGASLRPSPIVLSAAARPAASAPAATHAQAAAVS